MLVTLAVAVAPSAPAAAQATLCNDSFQDGGNASFQAGFVAGEGAAVKLAPPGDGYPFTVTAVRFLFGDDGTTAGQGFNVSARVYDDDGDSVVADPGFPGTLLGEEPNASVLSSPDSVSEIALSSPVTVTEGSVWVALMFTHSGAPGIARDDNGIQAGRNALFSGAGWADSSDVGLTGDWIIRAVVDTPSTSTSPACVFVGEGEGEGEGEGDGEGESEGEGEDGLFISSVNPAQAVAGAETRITITGGGFVEGVAFRVGSATATEVEVQNEGAALATVPATLAPGSYDVIAQLGADSFVFPSGFTVVAAGCGSCSAVGPWPAGLAVALLLCRSRRWRRGGA